MKKIVTLLIALLTSFVLVLAGCGGKTEDNNPPAPAETVAVTALRDSIEIGKYDVADMVYTSYFAIIDNGVSMAVRNEYIDRSEVMPEPGEYKVVCKYGNKQASLKVKVKAPEITLSATTARIFIKKKQVEGYDYAAHFKLTEDGRDVPLSASMLKGDVKPEPGDYTVTASAGDKTASLTVTVEKPIYKIETAQKRVEIPYEEEDAFDFCALFTLIEDGDEIPVTRDMLKKEKSDTPNEYLLVLEAGNEKATLTVRILRYETVEAYACYKSVDLTLEQLKAFDFTSLFVLFVKGEARKVTLDMIDRSSLENAKEGNEYVVTFSYSEQDSSASKSVTVRVVAPSEVRITAKNVETYPNSGTIDLKSLFKIYEGEKEIAVTADMIEGEVDYTRVGENTVTLRYGGKSATAVVFVRMGVVITAPETVKIKKGENKQNYDFIADFSVKVNGISFDLIPGSYLSGIENVDFDTLGKYEVTLSVPYCTTPPDVWSGTVDFDYARFTVVYEVVPSFYSVEVINPLVTLAEGTQSFDAFSNLKVTINGVRRTLTDNKDWVDGATCYAELKTAIDFSYAGEQRIRIAVYPDGADAEPVLAEYTLVIRSSVAITSYDRVVFVGATLEAYELFEISDGKNKIEPSFDMIEGKADTFTPGRYVLTLTYKNVSAQCVVAVIDDGISGEYFTGVLTAVESEVEEDYSDGSSEEDWGGAGGSATVVPSAPGKRLGDLIIDSDGAIVVNGSQSKIDGADSENNLSVTIGTAKYTAYYEDGNIVLVPVNEMRMSFSNNFRPLMYFPKDKYEYSDTLIINSTDDHVIFTTYTAYTIEVFSLIEKSSGEKVCYALCTRLVERKGADNYYEVKWGKAELSLVGGSVGEKGSVVFNDTSYDFTMVAKRTAKADKTSEVKRYAGMTFTGEADGKKASLIADRFEGFEYLVDGKTVISMSSYELASEKGGGADYENATVFMFGLGANEAPFSYKFSVNEHDKTFTLLPRDRYFGRYEADSRYIFIDGYGTGFICFDTKSYSKTRFTYEVKAGELVLTYFDTLPSFAYGKSASLTFDVFGNVLTPVAFENINLGGETFESKYVIDGAIVRVNNFVIGAQPSLSAESKFFEGLTIVTPEGTLTEKQKRECTDISAVSFTTPGFYRYTVTVLLGGVPTTATYALQVLENRYEDNDLAVSFGKGAVSGYFITLDKYGVMTLDCGGMTFKGLADIADGKVTARLKSTNGAAVKVEAQRAYDGLMHCVGSGTVVFDDYFTAGDIAVIGGKNFCLRAVTAMGKTYYFLSENSLIGKETDVLLEKGNSIRDNGAIISVVNASGKKIAVRLDKWGDSERGVTFAGSERGEYASEDGVIVLDGFGSATVGNERCDYVISGDKIALSGDGFAVYKLDYAKKTAQKLDYKADETLVSGKTYSASYVFSFDGSRYSATASFAFGEDGTVIVSSSSSDFEDGEYASKYSPSFTGKGTYSVRSGVITVTVGQTRFTFAISNVLEPVSVELTATTLTEGEQGYIAIGTRFDAEI